MHHKYFLILQFFLEKNIVMQDFHFIYNSIFIYTMCLTILTGWISLTFRAHSGGCGIRPRAVLRSAPAATAGGGVPNRLRRAVVCGDSTVR